MTTLTDLYQAVNHRLSDYGDHVSMCETCATHGRDACSKARELHLAISVAEQCITDHFQEAELGATAAERATVDQECIAAAEVEPFDETWEEFTDRFLSECE